MLNPEVLKCHEDFITLGAEVQQGKTMDNNASYIWLFGGSGGGGGYPGGGGGGVSGP